MWTYTDRKQDQPKLQAFGMQGTKAAAVQGSMSSGAGRTPLRTACLDHGLLPSHIALPRPPVCAEGVSAALSAQTT